MRRSIWITIIALLVIAPVAIWWQGKQRSVSEVVYGITLTNRPAKFCPPSAEVVITQGKEEKIVFDSEVTVKNCEQIPLEEALLQNATDYYFYVRLNEVRAFRLVVNGPVSSPLSHPILLGDLNNDNTIDAQDRLMVEEALKAGSYTKVADVDKDGKMGVVDHSLVTLNQGAGVGRPDGVAWKARQ